MPIKEFKTPFHIAIFKHFYSGLIRTKPIKIYAVDDQLYRHNSKQVSEQAETEITEIYKLMRRELVYKPLFKPLPHREAYFDVSTAPPDWMTPECLLNSRFQVGDKLLVSLRSYGSLVNGDSVCIFLLETLDQCR